MTIVKLHGQKKSCKKVIEKYIYIYKLTKYRYKNDQGDIDYEVVRTNL